MKFIPVVSLVVLLVSARSARADFAIRDGDTVVFLGDSITAISCSTIAGRWKTSKPSWSYPAAR